MSTPVISPSPEPQVQAVPTPAGVPPVAPVQPRHPDGTFAPVAVQPPPGTPPVQPPAPPVQAQPPAVPPPAPAPPAAALPFSVQDLGNGNIKVTYETGETFEGTPQKVVELTAAAHINTKKWAQQQRTQPTPPATPQPVAPGSPYADPTEEAAAKQLAELQAKFLGFPNAEAMRQQMSFIAQTAENSANRDLTFQFMAAQPDFNQTKENSEKLANIVGQMVPTDEAWARMPVDRQLTIMRAAHAFALMSKAYEPLPPPAAPPAVNPAITPPPPLPQGRAPQDAIGNIPPELVSTVNDSQAVILEKIGKLRQMGLMQ